MKKVFCLLTLIFCLALTVQAKYKIGDIYDKDGVKGIVVRVDDGGEHGLIMSLKGCDDRWCKSSVKTAVNATDENDGAVNMAAIEAYIAKKGLTLDEFPLFKWAKELGDGWYIPAKNELQTIAENLNGGSLETYNQKNYKNYSKIIKKNDGKGLILNGMGQSNEFLEMDTSTEAAGNMIYTLKFVENSGSKLSQFAFGKLAGRKGKLDFTAGLKTFNGGKLAHHYSRAVHKF